MGKRESRALQEMERICIGGNIRTVSVRLRRPADRAAASPHP